MDTFHKLFKNWYALKSDFENKIKHMSLSELKAYCSLRHKIILALGLITCVLLLFLFIFGIYQIALSLFGTFIKILFIIFLGWMICIDIVVFYSCIIDLKEIFWLRNIKGI